MNDFKHLITDEDGDNCLWVSLRAQNNNTTLPNTSLTSLLDELNTLFGSVRKTSSLKGIIIHAQPLQTSLTITANYDFSHLQGREQLIEFIKKGQATFQTLEDLKIPSLVIIDGLCPSICIKLALAADYCIASNSSEVRLRFPEITLGLLPATGGVQHAVKRMGVTSAMDALLTGNPLSGEKAVHTGLIDACVPETELRKTASTFINKQPRKTNSASGRFLNLPAIRPLIAFQLTRKANRLTPKDHYPAPHALIGLWQQFGNSNSPKAKQAYVESVADLAQTPQSISLVRLNKLKARLNTLKAVTAEQRANHIHLIGTSMTTCDIATYLILQNIHVTIQDKRPEAITHTLNTIRQNLITHFRQNEEQLNRLLQNITADPKGLGSEQADLIIVVKTYSLADSQEVFADLEERAKPDAIIATHSAIVALDKIAAALLKPQRLIGIHFCYPAFKTELTEVSYSNDTDPKVIEQTTQLIKSINKPPLLLKNSPGLLVDRVLAQYVLQGIRLHQQGVPHTVIDKSARDAGMPHGPLELADRIGLDYCLRISETLEKAFKIEIPFSLIEMVRTGKLGIKSGSGFYRYRNGNRLKPVRADWQGSEQALQEKLIRQITEEASMCLEEGLIEDPDLIDAGIVFGTGFAPFTGGPLYHQRHRTTQNKQA